MTQHQYKNIMEILVEQEVAHQIRKVPPQMVQYVRAVEVITYALNRLPVLYACSEKGMKIQLREAKQRYGPQIVQQVQWAITAVQRDPLRQFKPIQQKDQKTLDDLRTLLKNPELTWENVPQAVSQLLTLSMEQHFNQKRVEAPAPQEDEPKSPGYKQYRKKDTWGENDRKVKPNLDDFDWDQDAFVR
ncbi:MAG: late competence development ComFB family protein [Prochlorothrix sp.]|nr:late competence development ComFB family protein [Prochlorothrix sp.]